MPKMTQYKRHYEASKLIPASAQAVFEYIDDHSRFYSHVIKLSRILGGHIDLYMDDAGGRSVGSHIKLSGVFLGKSVSLEEVITRREPPRLKIWETTGTPRFLVIGQYQFAVSIEPMEEGSQLTISIDYDTPANSGGLKQMMSRFYARVCAGEMVRAARNHFKNLKS